MGSIPKPAIHKVSLIQLAILLLACLGILGFDGTLAISAFCGGLIAVVPNAYFSSYAFRYTGATQTPNVVRAFYQGQLGKFLLNMTGFAVVFTLYKSVNPAALFISFFAMVLLGVFISSRIIHHTFDQG